MNILGSGVRESIWPCAETPTVWKVKKNQSCHRNGVGNTYIYIYIYGARGGAGQKTKKRHIYIGRTWWRRYPPQDQRNAIYIYGACGGAGPFFCSKLLLLDHSVAPGTARSLHQALSVTASRVSQRQLLK